MCEFIHTSRRDVKFLHSTTGWWRDENILEGGEENLAIEPKISATGSEVQPEPMPTDEVRITDSLMELADFSDSDSSFDSSFDLNDIESL